MRPKNKQGRQILKLQKIVKVGTQTKLKATLESGFIKPLWVDVARKDGPQWSKIAKPFFLKEVPREDNPENDFQKGLE